MSNQHLKKYDHLVDGLYKAYGENHQGQPYLLDGKMNPSFRAYLISLGIVNTRCKDLSDGFNALWSALCKLDYRNLQIICNEFEGLASACKKFGEIEDMQCAFTNSKGEKYK